MFLLVFAHASMAQQQEKVVPFKEQSEEIQGAIYMVEPESGLVFLERNSVTYCFKVSPATRMTVNNQVGNLEALAARKGQVATVKFQITRNGNLAQEITVAAEPPMSTEDRMMMPMPCHMMGEERGAADCPRHE
jgi:hypothetical protein